MVTVHSDSDSDYQPSTSVKTSKYRTPKSSVPVLGTDSPPVQKMKLSSLVIAATIPAPGNLEHKREKIYGKKMSILTINGQRYLIGVQIAHLLQRETYNLYRSMKVKRITVIRGSSEQVDYLLKTNVVKPGTRSITFIPIDQGMAYINEEIKKVGARKKNKDKSKPYTVERTKLVTRSQDRSQEFEEPEIIAELEMDVSDSEGETHPDISAFEVLCAAVEDELNTQGGLTQSGSAFEHIPVPPSPPSISPISEVPTQTSSGNSLPPNFEGPLRSSETRPAFTGAYQATTPIQTR